ncbi:hypothetical protein HYH03_007250 [Edaphochlamys debaryana]|uniref:SET domain-containing protein n=1 Tax=Edaphochlamys debaryana TaxID=47281 RepID=A0A835Y5E2_9CHLO|nr:hypothetical protein HYH03_007250 [Edaphochlamys debaryana]|eukprot:KAG2494481.1 hypothetical protein HYH03_007250 [Edaphochlamys debaryana]
MSRRDDRGRDYDSYRDSPLGARGGRGRGGPGRGGGRGRGGGGEGRGGRGSYAGASSRGGRGRGRTASGESDRGRRRWASSGRGEYDSDDDDEDGDGVDDGIVVIGRADPASIAAKQAMVRSGPAGIAAAVAAAAATAAAASSAAGTAAADPLDGSRFWTEVSGIGDMDEEDDEDEEGEDEDEEGAEEEGDALTPEELLANMRELGFSLQDALTDAATANRPTANGPDAGDGDAEAPSTSSSSPAPAAATKSGGAEGALASLRDSFIASLRAGSLPPWFLGPVEFQTSNKPSTAGGPTANDQPLPTNRGVAMRTTRAVVAGELLAVSLPLGVAYCRRGTTPENEDLADLMMGRGPGGQGGEPGGGEGFAGLTDLQQSLLGLLWRGHGQPASAPTPAAAAAAPEPEPAPEAAAPEAVAEAPAEAPAAAPSGGRRGGRRRGGRGGGRGAASAEATGVPGLRRGFLELVAKSAADASAARGPPLLPPDDLYRLVNLNCLGEDFEDLALCTLRGEPPRGHVGLWPEPAFAPHSCCPSATAYTLGDRLIVRAAVDMPQGAEVSLNWVGSLLAAPLAQRSAELQAQYGFRCGCARCRAEERYEGTPLGSLLSEAHAAAGAMAAPLEEAIAAGDTRAVAGARDRLAGLLEEVEAGMRGAQPKVNARVKRFLQASVYDVYDLMSLCADELAAAAALGQLQAALDDGDEDEDDGRGARGGGRLRRSAAVALAASGPVVETESLAQCCRILEAVSPGSDVASYLAAELAMRCLERFGPQHEEYRQARAGVVRAFTARYGGVGAGIMESLVAARLAAEAAEEGGEEGGSADDEEDMSPDSAADGAAERRQEASQR